MKLKGKCKTCMGCNKLNEFGFKGTNHCKNYIKAESNWFLLIVVLIELAVIGFGIYGFYIYFSRLVGG